MSVGGINLCAPVSVFLDTLHKMETIQVCKNLGSVQDAEGNTVVAYSDPVTIEAQIQDPDASMLQHVERVQENAVHIAFYVSHNVQGIDRNDGKGGDKILYDGYEWYVMATPDNFSKQGWVCAIGGRTIESADA